MMKVRKLRKNLAIFLVFLLAFSNLVYAAPVAATAPAQGLPEKTQPTPSIEDTVDETVLAEQYGPEDMVRIVVELEKEPAISYATEQGVRYKDLADSVQAQLQEEIVSSQEAVKSTITSMGVNFDVEYSFTTALNGFSTEVTFREYELIKNAPGVSEVHISNVYTLPEEQEPNMDHSLELVRAMETWQDYGYDGEGMIVGIIDSGIDPWHNDMTLDEGVEISLTEEMVKASGLDGIYFTDKVPFGYNYMDKNTQILEQGPSVSSHGMHVAGTVAANGEIKGVAPNAQLLALRVFGDDPRFGSTYGDIYVKAIDDAILLGADVINLSLGSVAGFVRPEDPEQQAIARAVDNGIVAAISAGNSAHFSNALGLGDPLASNPDIGLTGAPSISYDSIGVASFENSFLEMEAFSWTAGEEEGNAAFLASNDYHKDIEAPKELIYVDHEGSIDVLNAKLAETDVEDKIVMLRRGLPFVDKTLAIQNAGGAGAIVANNTTGYVAMATDGSIVIPQVFISQTDGNQLVDLLSEGTEVFIEFGGESVVAPNPDAGSMSAFTSWGLTPNLDFKPEITAPGGNILSTLQGGGYGLKSGTSMAAPHVAGGSALVLQRVDEYFELEGYDRALKAKNILLNTSVPIKDNSWINGDPAFGLDNPYSPRRQGSGLMDLHAAMATPVVVTEINTGEAKAALREIGDTVSFTLQAENFGDEDVTYEVNGNVQTDLVVSGRNWVEAQGVFDSEGEYPIGFDGVNESNELIVPAGGTVEFTVTLDLEDAVVWNSGTKLTDLFPNGAFVEGFVTLTNEGVPPLAIPYVGFYGEWDEAPIIDAKWYEAGAFHTWTGLFSQTGSRLTPIPELEGFDDVNNIFAFSPEVSNGVNPVLTFLRNAEAVQYNILDEDGERLRTIRLESDVRKNHAAPGYTFDGTRNWDGTVNRSVVEDGLYYYEVKARVDFEDARWQSVQFPVLVDTAAPVVTVDYDFDAAVIEWEVSEEASGLQSVEILVDGEEQSTVDVSEDRFAQSGEFDVSGVATGATVEIVAVDRAGNTTVESVPAINDDTVPYIYIDSPVTLTAFDSFEIPVSGYIVDSSEVVEFKVNGEVTEVTFNEEANYFEFDTTVTFEEDGAPDIFFEMTDAGGNYVSIKRQVIVDTTAPVLEVNAPAFVSEDTNEVTVDISVSDNFNQLRLFVNDSEEYFNALRAPFGVSDFSDELELTLSLGEDVNTFTFELVDVAGNVTEEVVTITKVDAFVSRIEGHTRFDTAVEVSQEGWESSDVVILTRADDFTDALSGAPLAKKYDAPMLLTRNGSLPKATADEIARLGATEVIILGGHLAVGEAVEQELESLVPSVRRIEGQTRWETSALIAQEVAPEGSEEAVVVYGRDFPDALAIAPYAAAKGMPILLTEKEDLPKATADALETLNVEKTYALGGHLVMSDEVFNALPGGERFAGQTRFDTAMMVVEEFDQGAKHFYVATVNDHVDALAGATLAAKQGTGILLVGDSVRDNLKSFVADNGVEKLTVLGGELAVSDAVFGELVDLIVK